MKRIILSLLLCLTFLTNTNAAGGDSVYNDRIYSHDIKTVQFGLYGVTLAVPVLTLNGTNQLQLSFDDLSGEDRTYYYSILQCNANWTASDLLPMDYLTGFNDDQITDYQPSFNTLQPYTHYEVIFPDQDVSITKSGNYIIKVYADDDPNQVVFTRRFMVVDQQVKIWGQIVRPDDVNHIDTHQQVNFSVNYTNLTVNDPFNELIVVVQQNNRFDNEVVGLKPQFVQSGKLDYQLMPELVFPGGKEFRYFDMQSLIYKGYHVDELNDSDNRYYIKLSVDNPRTYEQYSYNKDINGKFLINVDNSTHSNEEGDYVNVQFRLKMDYPILGGKVYVTGALTDWQALPEYYMTYDFDRHMYIANIYLKQGYYNYAYAYVEIGKKDLNLSELEGDSYETENDYTIYVYYHPFGARHDQLVGIQTINSLNQNINNNKTNTNNGTNAH
jgi:hypothetical protein